MCSSIHTPYIGLFSLKLTGDAPELYSEGISGQLCLCDCLCVKLFEMKKKDNPEMNCSG